MSNAASRLHTAMHQTQLQECIQLCAKHYFKITYSYMMMMTKNFNMPSGFKTIRAKHCLKITYNGYVPNTASRLHTAMRQIQLQDYIQPCAKHSFKIAYSYAPNTASRLRTAMCQTQLQDYNSYALNGLKIISAKHCGAQLQRLRRVMCSK